MKRRCAFASCLVVSLLSCASSLTIARLLPPDGESNPLGDGAMCVEDFVDARPSSRTVGEARTGLFNAKVPIRLEAEPSLEVSSALRAALARKGWLSSTCEGAKRVLGGTVRQFWVAERIGFTAEYSTATVAFEGVIRDASRKIVWVGEAEASYQSPSSSETTKVDEEALRTALVQATEKFVSLPGVANAIAREE